MTKPGRTLIEQALTNGASALDEDAGKQFFAEYGIAVPQGGTVTSADDAVALATRIGFPVVMKGSAPTIQHKTDAGLVILRVSDETEVREAYRTLEARTAAAGATLDGVLVEHGHRQTRVRRGAGSRPAVRSCGHVRAGRHLHRGPQGRGLRGGAYLRRRCLRTHG